MNEQPLEAISVFTNQVATETQEALDAEAVVVLAVVRKHDGLELAIGSTGTEAAILVLVDDIRKIADALRDVAGTHKSSLSWTFDNAN